MVDNNSKFDLLNFLTNHFCPSDACAVLEIYQIGWGIMNTNQNYTFIKIVLYN